MKRIRSRRAPLGYLLRYLGAPRLGRGHVEFQRLRQNHPVGLQGVLPGAEVVEHVLADLLGRALQRVSVAAAAGPEKADAVAGLVAQPVDLRRQVLDATRAPRCCT